MGTPVPIWTSAHLLQCIPNSTCTINLPCISDYFRITSSIALMAMNPIKSNHQLSPDAALVTGAASVIGTGSVATPGRASERHKCEEHTWLGCNLTFYTLFSLSHRKLRPAIASTETSAMQWEARTRRPPNHFQLIEPEKGTKTIVIAPHKFMYLCDQEKSWFRALVDMFSPGTGSPSSAKAFVEAVQTQSILWSVGCWWIKKNHESIKCIFLN